MNMEFICDNNLCTGCMACVNVCKHNAIQIIQDQEGFYRPYINQEKCVNCGFCQKQCPVNSSVTTNQPIAVYSGWIKNEDIRKQSSSGGAFAAISIPILKDKGIVFGACLNQDLIVEHVFIENENELPVLQGSKYVQSDIKTTYQQTEYFLQQSKKVLFSGTPCQIAGLKNFLKKDYDNLITVDLICHGVPSPKIFEDWKSWFKEQNQLSDINSIKFRSKEKSWIYFNMDIKGTSKSGKEFRYIGRYYKDAWIRGFLRDCFLRPSCHRCQYAKITRCSDLTIADWWGYKAGKEEAKDFESKGVSLILCNTSKGYEYFSNKCMKSMSLKKRTIEEAIKTNKSLQEPFGESNLRTLFWRDYFTLPFYEIVKKYMYPEVVPLHIWLKIQMKPSLIRRILCSIFYRLHTVFKI